MKGSVETLKNMVKSQMGFTLVPELSVIDSKNDSSMIKRFVNPEPVREISIVVHRNFNKNGMLQAQSSRFTQTYQESIKKASSKNRIGWI